MRKIWQFQSVMLLNNGTSSCPFDFTTLKSVDAELAKYSNARKTVVSQYIPVQILYCSMYKRAFINNSVDSNFIRLAAIKYLTIVQYSSKLSEASTLTTTPISPIVPNAKIEVKPTKIDGQSDVKIGVLVRSTLTKMLERHEISEKEIALMQTAEYSKQTFDIQFPLLRKASRSNGKKILRYWAGAVEAYGEKYFICSEWYEVPQNNDRPYFMKWLGIRP